MLDQRRVRLSLLAVPPRPVVFRGDAVLDGMSEKAVNVLGEEILYLPDLLRIGEMRSEDGGPDRAVCCRRGLELPPPLDQRGAPDRRPDVGQRAVVPGAGTEVPLRPPPRIFVLIYCIVKLRVWFEFCVW